MSGKRRVDNGRDGSLKNGGNDGGDDMEHDDGLVFEDPFGDEYEEEEVIDDEEQEEGIDEGAMEAIDSDRQPSGAATRVWRAGIDALEEGETLEYDPSAYVTYHSLRTEWPCLSFDVVRDNLGESRQRFPLSMMLMCGSQADRAERNKITILKVTDIHKTQIKDDSDGESDDDDAEDDDPVIEHLNVNHMGGVNRIRCMPQDSGIVATMSDSSRVHIYDLSRSVRSMQVKGSPRAQPPSKPAYTFKGHRHEGFALDWSHVTAGQLATGDCAGSIHIWNTTGSDAPSSSWRVGNAMTGHEGSVEDLQWSPTESTVFGSASSDKTVRIWDTRGRSGPQITVDAHSDDVNVISWSRSVTYLLASGCDDGSFKVWDLRAIREAQPLAHFRFHRQAVTSIEWSPHDESMLTLSSADNQVTVWDLSVESDEDPALDMHGETADGMADFPPQLLFIHQGQTNVKEVHHHPQIPGLILSSAEDSFNVFKPAITVSAS